MTRLRFLRLKQAISFGGEGSVIEFYGETTLIKTDFVHVSVSRGSHIKLFPFVNVLDAEPEVETNEKGPFSKAAELASTIDQKVAYTRKKT